MPATSILYIIGLTAALLLVVYMFLAVRAVRPAESAANTRMNHLLNGFYMLFKTTIAVILLIILGLTAALFI